MATVTTRGFTIIELMLFLGITGAMFAALMVGVNGNIIQQRYRESVYGYGAMLQNQFSEVANTRNERDDKWSCTDGNIQVAPVSGDPRGRSECVLLGKAVQVANNGTTIQTFAVVGKKTTDATSSDIQTLIDYGPKRAEAFNPTSTELDWNAKLVTREHLPSEASYLILRSPASGLIRVFTSVNPLPADLSTMITVANAVTSVTNCVDGDRGLLPPHSVTIDPTVAGPDSVFTLENDGECV